MICWRENARLAVKALACDKMKACLTMLGVLIGTAALVLVIAISSAGKEYVLALIQGIGSNLVYAELKDGGISTIPEDEMTLGDLIAAQHAIPGITAAAGTWDNNASFRVGPQIHPAHLVVVSDQFQQIRNLQITSGRYFDPEAFTSLSKICMVSDHMAKLAFDGDGALGKIVQLGDFRCTVIGTFHEGIPTFGQSEIQNDTVLLPLSLIADVTTDRFFKTLYVQAASASQVELVRERLQNILTLRHRPQAHYSVDTLSAVLKSARRASLAGFIVLVLLAVVTLTVAGVGIMNIMLANVSERVQEIGLRKTCGASPRDIRMQFLMEAAFISVGGAVLGVVIALLVLVSADWVTRFVHVAVHWPAVVLALVLCSAIGIIFGYRPACHAAKLSPIDALRVE